MKEIIDLHERILAHYGEEWSEDGIHFTRDDTDADIGDLDGLPADLQEEIAALRQSLDNLLPEDFDYYAVLGAAGEPALFGLQLDESPAGGTADGTFDPARPLLDQLRSMDWEERRAAAERNGHILDEIQRASERISKPLPPAKQFQRLLREETKEFIKEKRRDTARLHVMYWQADDGVMEIDFPDGDELRAALPDLVGGGAEIVTIVAFGKPLPVERIDALKAAAIEVYADQPLRGTSGFDAADDNVIDVEAEVIEPHPALPGKPPAAAPQATP